MSALVTLQAAKAHLRITDDANNDDVRQKAEHASDIILSYLKIATSPPYYTEATAPFRVQAATLLMLTHLYEKRGDDPDTDEAVWDAIGRLLVRDRDPALA